MFIRWSVYIHVISLYILFIVTCLFIGLRDGRSPDLRGGVWCCVEGSTGGAHVRCQGASGVTSTCVQRVGYLGLMLLLDETHETLMMVTNSLKTDLNRFGDPYIVLNALTALANICSAGMAADLAPEVERLADGRFLQRNGITGALAGHIRKKALLAACRMVTRAPDLEETFRDVPGSVIPDGNHAVVMAGAPPPSPRSRSTRRRRSRPPPSPQLC